MHSPRTACAKHSPAKRFNKNKRQSELDITREYRCNTATSVHFTSFCVLLRAYYYYTLTTRRLHKSPCDTSKWFRIYRCYNSNYTPIIITISSNGGQKTVRITRIKSHTILIGDIGKHRRKSRQPAAPELQVALYRILIRIEILLYE